MAIDKEKYISGYVDESLENISVVESLLFEVKEGSSIEDDIATLFRSLHTLKGSSRMLEFKQMEALAHALESVFVAVKEQRIVLTDKAMRLCLASLDMLTKTVRVIQETRSDAVDVKIFEKELAALVSNEDYNVPPEQTAYAPIEEKRAQLLMQEVPDIEDMVDDLLSGIGVPHEQQPVKDKPEQPAPNKPHGLRHTGRSGSESIRIPLEKIDDIIKNMASMQSFEINARNLVRESERINELCHTFDKNMLAEYQASDPMVKKFRQIEQAAGKIASKIKNYALDVGNHTKGAYDSVISLRMLPLATVLDAYPRFVFETAAELGKKVQLVIEGAENEIDKNIIETLSDVFLHTVRNAIDHGIESPNERVQMGKNEAGHISITCIRESGNMKITISDDGCGIDIEAIRQKIVTSGAASAEDAAAMTQGDLVNFIFQSGFSTSEKITGISGRGVGMDVVRSNMEHIKGSIIVNTTPGQGTAITILAPLSIASLLGFPVRSGSMKFIIPANFVDTILLTDKKDILSIVDRPAIKFENSIIKLYYLSQILQIKSPEQYGGKSTLFVVIIKSYEDTVALAVDGIDSMRSVILKTLPSLMEHMSVFSGVVLSEDYEMVPVLHLPTIILMAKHTKPIDMKRRHIEYEKMLKSILVADDSPPTREIVRDILLAEGYKVDTAADGGEALKMTKANRYNLICTDINMPQMDGFMLTENIRRNSDIADIPIIVISSRASDDDKKRAEQLGANRFIVKNAFNNRNLLNAVHDLIGEANG